MPRRLCFLFFAIILLAPIKAWGHPEGFSGLHVTIEAGKATAALTLHTRDLGAWFPPGRYTDYVNDVCRELEKTAGDVVEAELNGETLPIKDTKAFLIETGLVELDVIWELPAVTEPAELLVWSKHLYLMPRGHQQLLFVEDRRDLPEGRENGKLLLEDILSVERDAGVCELAADQHPASLPSVEPAPTVPVPLPPTEATSGRTPLRPAPDESPRRISFFMLGVEHILTGYDHLLFLAALLLTCASLAEAAKIITCFTVAHSITLALAALDVVQLSAGIVEPAIAASIVYVAIENLVSAKPALWHRVAITFAFGLIHGLGFASVLRDIGLGTVPGGVIWPLLRFNLGVEAGQLCVAAVVFQLVRYARKYEPFQMRLVRHGSQLIALCGGYWLVTRILSQLLSW